MSGGPHALLADSSGRGVRALVETLALRATAARCGGAYAASEGAKRGANA